MNVQSEVPFQLDAEELRAGLRIPAGSADASTLRDLTRIAQRIGKPKAAYREAFVGARLESAVQIEGVTFTSPMLRRNLAEVERVFAFVVTCGREVYEACPADGDMLLEYWWDAIMADMLFAAHGFLSEHLEARYRLGPTATMSPGSGDAGVWPIEQQQELFGLMGDVRGAIGVELTPSCLMIPNKTISGIRFTTETGYRACQVCRRERCPSRSAPFDHDLWEEAQVD